MSQQNSHKEIYFDNNATTKPLPEVRDEVCRVLGEEFGNPSSMHSTGDRARKLLYSARRNIADLLGCEPENIIFTSSGTEANNLILYSCSLGAKQKSRVVTTDVEHSSIIKMCGFLDIHEVSIEYIKVDSYGVLDMDQLEKALSVETDLVSVQWVNNETGVIQEIDKIKKICKEKNVPFHTDAAQAIGKLEFNLENKNIDYLALAGHKFHAPQGVGAIYTNNKFSLHPFQFGGFQEEGFRPGTENLPGIVGMGKAAEIRKGNIKDTIKYLTELRDLFEGKILESVPNTKVNGSTSSRICNTSNIMFEGIDGRKLTMMLDEAGIRCSQSSACTNFDTSPSYVLIAMGLSEEQAYSSIRFSFCGENTTDEINEAVEIIVRNYEKLLN